MRNIDLGEKHFQISDPIENYFECISACDINDGNCIFRAWKYLNRMTFKTLNYFVVQ